MKAALFFLIAGCFCISVSGQVDSLENELKITKNDAANIELLCDLSYAYIYTDTVKSGKYLGRAIELGKKTKDNYSLGLINYSIGNLIFTTQTSSDKPKEYFVIAQKYFAKVDHEKGIYGNSLVYNALADIFLFEGKWDDAIKNFLSAIKLVEGLPTKKATTQLAAAYSGIGSVYLYLAQYDKGIDYKLKAIDLFESLKNNDHELAMTYMQAAYGYCFSGKMTQTKSYLEKGRTIFDTLKEDNEAYMQYYEISGQYYGKTGQQKKAIEEQKLALAYAQKISNISYISTEKYMLAQNYFSDKQYANAKNEFLDCLQLAGQLNDNRIKLKVFSFLSECEENLGNTASALQYMKMQFKIGDSLKIQEAKVEINKLENKYQAAKKEKQIIFLENEKQKQNGVITALVSGFIVLIIIVLLVFINNKQKQVIQTKKIKELEQEKQLVAINTILQAQETERSRMAKDLHDGLGGMLSGIKLNLSAMKGNMIIGENDAQLFARSISQLDSAIAEMRRVAHNMMPEALLKFGLSEAIQDFCDSINESNTVKMRYTTLGPQGGLEKSTEVILYRIIQELTNNAIKHAMAKNIFIQLIIHEKGITLTVEDDGKGFDTAQLSNIKGAGLKNVQSRVDYLKGILEIDSKTGEGSSFNIEIPVLA
ncbi:MAG: ATP-binding protein [Ginsengibacter sp.]